MTYFHSEVWAKVRDVHSGCGQVVWDCMEDWSSEGSIEVCRANGCCVGLAGAWDDTAGSKLKSPVCLCVESDGWVVNDGIPYSALGSGIGV